jgi:hypothetical protein
MRYNGALFLLSWWSENTYTSVGSTDNTRMANDNWQGKTEALVQINTCASATLSTTIPTWKTLAQNPEVRG